MADVLSETSGVSVVDGVSPSLGHVIDEIFCFIAVDEEGEGIPAITLPGIGTMPMLGADMARVEALRPEVERLAKVSGRTIKLVKFTTRVELEEIG